MTNQDEITVVMLGQRARERGLGKSDNPYLPDDPRHDRWNWGWEQRDKKMSGKASA